jgi:hypothetical protein
MPHKYVYLNNKESGYFYKSGNFCSITSIKADFQSSHEAPRSSLRVHAWALSSNHNAKQLILIRGLEIRL